MNLLWRDVLPQNSIGKEILMKKMEGILRGVRKKENALLFAFLFTMFFVGCGNDSNEGGNNVAEPVVVTVIVTSTPQPTPEPEVIIKEVPVEVTVIVTPAPMPTEEPTKSSSAIDETESVVYIQVQEPYVHNVWMSKNEDETVTLHLVVEYEYEYDDTYTFVPIGENAYKSTEGYFFLYIEDKNFIYLVDRYKMFRHDHSGMYMSEEWNYDHWGEDLIIDEDD